jgi:hypothetical protein
VSNEPAIDEPVQDPFLKAGIRYYLFAGFTGLLVVWLILMDRFDLFALAPAAIGALGMIGYAIPDRFGAISRRLHRPRQWIPPLVLLMVVLLTALFETSFHTPEMEFGDVVLAAAMLTYLVSQYRLFSLGSAAFPPDTRPRPDRPIGDEPELRPDSLMNVNELFWMILVVIQSLIMGLIIWDLVSTNWRLGETSAETRWRFVSLMWVLGLGALVLVGFFRILRNYRMSEDEARMVLQDTLWTETRGDQRRIARWMAWQRRQLQRRREDRP